MIGVVSACYRQRNADFDGALSSSVEVTTADSATIEYAASLIQTAAQPTTATGKIQRFHPRNGP